MAWNGILTQSNGGPSAREDGEHRLAQHTSFARFPSLPEELIKLIFEYACQPRRQRETEEASQQSSSSLWLDVPSTRSLMLVSRAAYNLVIPLLYRSVTIARPSQLIAFAATLLTRPSLGLLVRNLWVGTLTSPPINFLPLIISDVELAVAAKGHITRFTQLYADTAGCKIHHETARDLVYVENGVEYASMHAPPTPNRLVEPDPSAHTGQVRQAVVGDDVILSDWEHASNSSQSSRSKGYGVDRMSLGYDAAGDWIGMDEWMLRCLEVQHAIEFHWEWVGITTPPTAQDEELRHQDERAKSSDPMDWDDATEPVAPLPSRQREFSSDTMASSSTTEYLRSNASKIGFAHIQQFFTLRQNGYAPREAASILIERYLKLVSNGPVPVLADVCNIDMLADAHEADHFLHPALFARSGAIHLIVPAEAPEGPNAPPNAVPAAAAAMSSFHDETGSADTDSSDEEAGQADAAAPNEGVRARRTYDVLDFVDLFGHVQSQSRTMYAGLPLADQGSELSQTVTQSHMHDAALLNGDRTSTRHRRWRRPAPTLGSLLANMRAVLAMCPRVRALGLNGFLERAVGGARESAGLSDLRHLSLGPPPPFWSSALNLHRKTLRSLRTLHISGCMLFRSEAMAVGGFTPALPRLREVDWTLWLGHVLEHPINVVEALGYLLGKVGPSAGTSQSRRLEHVQRSKPLRRIRATLNAKDVEYFKRHAGVELLEDPRLLLRQCTSNETDVNLRAVRRWWEAKAGLL